MSVFLMTAHSFVQQSLPNGWCMNECQDNARTLLAYISMYIDHRLAHGTPAPDDADDVLLKHIGVASTDVTLAALVL
jgi:hypothetical protein